MKVFLALATLSLAACASTSSSGSDAYSPTPQQSIPGTTPVSSTPVSTPVSTVDTSAAPSTTGASNGIVNSWSPSTIDPTALPLGTAHVSTTVIAAGTLFVCDSGNPNGGGAFAVGPWINEAAGTWDSTTKVRVLGEVSWPSASYSEKIEGTQRVIVANGLPTESKTGTFPIGSTDPAFSYDRNPNSISPSAISISLTMSPQASASPACLPKGAIGVVKNGVALFAPIDERNRDAVAYETQDLCDGHPQQSGTYHYHDIPSCIRDAAKGSSTVIGFAFDGFPIVIERDAAGNLPTNNDLDECHGRTSPIELDGSVVSVYHYSATLEFPYFMGCYRGTR